MQRFTVVKVYLHKVFDLQYDSIKWKMELLDQLIIAVQHIGQVRELSDSLKPQRKPKIVL